MTSEPESKATAETPAKKKTSAKKSTPKPESITIDIELIGRIPTSHKYGYDEVRVTVKDIPTTDMSETVRKTQQNFDKSLIQTRKFHRDQMDLDEIVEYLM